MTVTAVRNSHQLIRPILQFLSAKKTVLSATPRSILGSLFLTPNFFGINELLNVKQIRDA